MMEKYDLLCGSMDFLAVLVACGEVQKKYVAPHSMRGSNECGCCLPIHEYCCVLPQENYKQHHTAFNEYGCWENSSKGCIHSSGWDNKDEHGIYLYPPTDIKNGGTRLQTTGDKVALSFGVIGFVVLITAFITQCRCLTKCCEKLWAVCDKEGSSRRESVDEQACQYSRGTSSNAFYLPTASIPGEVVPSTTTQNGDQAGNSSVVASPPVYVDALKFPPKPPNPENEVLPPAYDSVANSNSEPSTSRVYIFEDNSTADNQLVT